MHDKAHVTVNEYQAFDRRIREEKQAVHKMAIMDMSPKI